MPLFREAKIIIRRNDYGDSWLVNMAHVEFRRLGRRIFIVVLVSIVLLLIFSFFLVMLMGPIFVFSEEGSSLSYQYRHLPILLFIIFGFYTPFAINFGLAFLFLWGVFVICFVAAWIFRVSFWNIIEGSFLRPLKTLFDNYLFAFPVVSSMLLIAMMFLQGFQEAGGIPTGEPLLPANPFQVLFELSYAVLIEEIGFRITPIGAFLIIYLFWVGGRKIATLSWRQRLKLFLLAPLLPDVAKRMLELKNVRDFGIKAGISFGEWVMVLFTSIVFGLAHYLYGGGWEIGKITTATVVGLVIGLTYLLYGIQAPILLHWFFNYYLWFFDATEQGGFQFISNLNTSIPLLFDFVGLTILILGVIGWLAVAIQGLRRFRQMLARAH